MIKQRLETARHICLRYIKIEKQSFYISPFFSFFFSFAKLSTEYLIDKDNYT